MSEPRYYYINEDGKRIKHFENKLTETPEGYVFCGLSELPVKGAAGYYAKNQSGFTIENGDPKTESKSPDVPNNVPEN